LASFRASGIARQRVWDLVRKEKKIGLAREAQCGLDVYEKLEHLLILAKARAGDSD
jgi:hypothetical protein